MATLREIVGEVSTRQQMIDDTVKLIDAEVSDKGGISGLALKTAYAMAKGLAPGTVPRLMNGFLDDFMGELQPYYDEAKQKGVDFKAHVAGKSSEVANALLKVTDARAAKAGQGTLKKGYEKLRPTAQKHVEQALPRLADLVNKIAR